MESPERKNVERNLGIMLTDAIKGRIFLHGDSWFYFLNVASGSSPILKLNAVADKGNRYQGFVTEREIYRIGETEKFESLTQERKVSYSDIEELKKMAGIKKDPLAELLEE
jgi:hypothetical protein